MYDFVVTLQDATRTETVRAYEMDVMDGTLVFMGRNRGGYVAAFAQGHWVSVSSDKEDKL